MKTKTLLLMSLFLLLLQTNIFAQNNGEIIYTNFEPDSIIDLTPMGNDVFFDINNDGQYEIKFSWFFHSAVADILHSISTMSKKMLLTLMDTIGQDISSQETWRISYDDTWDFPVEPAANHLIGFRQEIDEEYYYGWISYTRINKKHEDYLVLHDMAFCTIPNYPLKFGQNSFIGINEIDAPSTSVNAFYNNGTGTLKVKSDMEINNIEVIDVLGRTLYRKVNMASDSFEADLSGFTNGIYIVRAVLSDKTATSTKFVIYGSK